MQFSLCYFNIVLIEPYGLQLLPLLELIFKHVHNMSNKTL